MAHETRPSNDKTVYYADNSYFGGLTYRYLIGIEGGATFLNNFVATTFDDVTRVAAMLLIKGDMEKVRKVASFVPTYLVNASADVVEKYKAANQTNAWGYDQNGNMFYFNQAQPLQKVIMDRTSKVDSSLIGTVYNNFMTKYFRIPVVKANLYSASTLYSDYKWNQAPYSLGERNAIVDGKTADGIDRRGRTS